MDPDASRSAALTVLARYKTGEIDAPKAEKSNGESKPKKAEKPRPTSLAKPKVNEEADNAPANKLPIIVSPG